MADLTNRDGSFLTKLTDYSDIVLAVMVVELENLNTLVA